MMWMWLAVSICLGAFGQIFMKEGMKAAGPVPMSGDITQLARYFFGAILTFQLIAAAFCYGLSFLLWLAVLSVIDLSLARPLMAFGYFITMIYGFYAGEHMSWERVAGTVLIAVGIFFTARSGAA